MLLVLKLSFNTLRNQIFCVRRAISGVSATAWTVHFTVWRVLPVAVGCDIPGFDGPLPMVPRRLRDWTLQILTRYIHYDCRFSLSDIRLLYKYSGNSARITVSGSLHTPVIVIKYRFKVFVLIINISFLIT